MYQNHDPLNWEKSGLTLHGTTPYLYNHYSYSMETLVFEGMCELEVSD